MSLPKVINYDEYRQLNMRDELFHRAAAELLRKHDLPFEKMINPSDGSSPVLLVDNTYVVKFIADVFEDGFNAEYISLKTLTEWNMPAPQLKFTGMVENWHYLIMTRMKGSSLKQLWPNLNLVEKENLCFQVGRSLRKIHDQNVQNVHLPPGDWYEFLEKQTANCVTQHQKNKLTENWLGQIPAFLDSVPLGLKNKRSFLHTEVMRDHTFSENLQFTGFIDFEPAMVGDPEYDFASVGIFLTSGDPVLNRAFFAGYDCLAKVDADFKRRCMAYALLHRYGNLRWNLELMPAGTTLDELAQRWWAIH